MKSVKKYRAGGRMRGDDEGRAFEDMEVDRAEREALDADREYHRQVNRSSDRASLAAVRNWQANDRANQMYAAARGQDFGTTKEDMTRTNEINDFRRRFERGMDTKKPAAMKKGGAVKRMASGGKVRGDGICRVKTKGTMR